MNKDKSTKNILIEVCVDTLASALAAQTGGASRIELCSALSEGGLTPSSGTIAQARQLLTIGIFVMIRPRTGNFVYSKDDFNTMLLDIKTARELGAAGIVAGILNPDSSVDVERTIKLVKAARPLPFTFHRAFDLIPDPIKAMEEIISCGCSRILTSGQLPTAIEGKELIRKMIQLAGDRIIILPGSGISDHNVAELVSETGAKEVHLSGRKLLITSQNNTKHKVDEASFYLMYETDPMLIHRVLQEANSIHNDLN
jgi:copper homeostasis protein